MREAREERLDPLHPQLRPNSHAESCAFFTKLRLKEPQFRPGYLGAVSRAYRLSPGHAMPPISRSVQVVTRLGESAVP